MSNPSRQAMTRSALSPGAAPIVNAGREPMITLRAVHRIGGRDARRYNARVKRAPFYGWIVVAGGFLVLFIAYGTQYAFGVFFGALIDEFGWSRASLSGVFSLYTVVYSALALAAGRLTDRWGPRSVIAL